MQPNQPVKKNSQLYEAMRRLCKSKTAMMGLIVIILIILAAVFADVLFSYDDVVIKQNIPNMLQGAVVAASLRNR